MGGKKTLEEYSVEMKNISKSFGQFKALDDVNLQLRKGEILGLVGENGAGKSTLMKILSGACGMDSGSIFIDGKPVVINSVEDSRKTGISIIYQELSLIPSLNIAENLFICKELIYGKKAHGLSCMNIKAMEKSAKNILHERLGVDMDVRTSVRELSLSQRQIVEIARALSSDASIIIMDEPTAALEKKERENFFEIIQALKKDKTSIIFVSHALEEITQNCDSVLVIRDGRIVGYKRTKDLDINEIINLMIGKNLNQQYIKRKVNIGEPVLQVENISDVGIYENISFTLHKGEIIGFAGLDGCGKKEIVRTIFGIHKKISGTIKMKGVTYHPKSPEHAIKNKIVFLPAERKTEGILADKSVKWNITIANLDRIHKVYVRNRLEEKLAVNFVNTMRIKLNGVDQPLASLSGGNQQKVLVARWLFAEPDVIIMEEPSHGIDVNAKTEIYEYMMQSVESGKGILLVSSELPELMAICDRIIVINRGKLVADLKASETNQHEITNLSVNTNYSENRNNIGWT
jgi:ABC-type sugar transport system ATPase subunit